MPANSIDSFFACTLIVIVVMVSMVATTKIVSPYIDSMQDLNEEEYLRKIVENILVSPGNPTNWGNNQTMIPTAFGLAQENSFTYELDCDKICRLNSNNTYALNYLEMFEAIRLEKVALRFTFTQIMDVLVTLDSNVTDAESSTYTFNISVSRNQAPVATTLHCYVVANNFLNDTYSTTSSTGQGVVEVEIPNTSNGTALLVVFARSPYDNRITAQGICTFRHLSPEPLPNNTFLSLSPLNNTLLTDPNVSGVSLQTVYQFSYSYEASLSSTSNETYTIPKLLDSSPKALVTTGWNASSFFVEYTTYPQVPTEMGANFEDAECYSFNYLVLVDQVFYRLNVQCGGPSL